MQIFPGENAPGPPYFIIHPTATLPPPTVSLQNTARGMSTLFWPPAGLILKQLNN